MNVHRNVNSPLLKSQFMESNKLAFIKEFSLFIKIHKENKNTYIKIQIIYFQGLLSYVQ